MPRLNAFSLILPEIKELLKIQDYKSIAGSLKEMDPIDLADSWQALLPPEQAVVFGLLPRRFQTQLFEELELEEQKNLIASLQNGETETSLSSLEPSAASRVVRQLPPRLVTKFKQLMKKEDVMHLEHSLSFSPDSVANIMRVRFITIQSDWTTHRALEYLRVNTKLRHADDLYLDIIYVTDQAKHLVGQLFLKDLIVAPSEMRVGALMSPRIQSLLLGMDQEEAANLFKKYKLESAPVVDQEQKPVGILLFKDILKVIQQETEEDFAKMAGTKAGLLSLPVFDIAKVRFPWLIATCLGYFVVGWVVKSHELTLSKVIGLASFMPLIAAMGGNVGAQTATAVVRGMATGEVKILGAKEIIFKEMLVGVLLGVLYGLAAGLVAHLIYGNRFGWQFGVVVGTGMFASMSAAAIMGSLEPFIFEKINIDPATATGPLITFFADLTSTSVYLTIATWLLLRF